jgi:hypothetical protein
LIKEANRLLIDAADAWGAGQDAGGGRSFNPPAQEVLGNDDIEHAELYSRAAEQALLATKGMDRVIDLHELLAG